MINEKNNRYGQLTVLDLAFTKPKDGAFWVCKCDCGNTITVRGTSLRSGQTKSCGCLLRKSRDPRPNVNPEDIVGERFNNLLVDKFVSFEKRENKKGFNYYYECTCDCGNKIIAERRSLKIGEVKSCGCLKRKKYGYVATNTRIYKIWDGMKQRCYNKNSAAYNWYGGKGIGICQEWLDDFITFRNWSYANGYHDPYENQPNSEWLTIDRIDPSKDYSPSNCRWVTKSQNSSFSCKTTKRNSKGMLIRGEGTE